MSYRESAPNIDAILEDLGGTLDCYLDVNRACTAWLRSRNLINTSHDFGNHGIRKQVREKVTEFFNEP